MSQSHSRQARAGSLGLPSAIASCLVLATLCGAAWSQSAPTPAAASVVSDSDRAKRDAEKVFQWIRIHSDKPRKAAGATPAVAPAAPVVAAPVVAARPRPASKGNEGGITETVTPLVAARTEAPREAAAPAVPAPVESSTAAAPAGLDKPGEMLVASAAQKSRVEVDEDLMLIPVHRTEPEFPKSLMRTLRKGVVQVSFTVKPDGTVTQAQAVSSSHPRLKDVALATVQEWRFQPLRHAQQAVVDLGFNLD